MTVFIIRRLLQASIVVMLMSVIVFFGVNVIQGSGVETSEERKLETLPSMDRPSRMPGSREVAMSSRNRGGLLLFVHVGEDAFLFADQSDNERGPSCLV